MIHIKPAIITLFFHRILFLLSWSALSVENASPFRPPCSSALHLRRGASPDHSVAPGRRESPQDLLESQHNDLRVGLAGGFHPPRVALGVILSDHRSISFSFLHLYCFTHALPPPFSSNPHALLCLADIVFSLAPSLSHATSTSPVPTPFLTAGVQDSPQCIPSSRTRHTHTLTSNTRR